MAKKGTVFGTLLALGGIAAAGTLLYRKHRDTIHAFLRELTEAPGDDAEDELDEDFGGAPEEEALEEDGPGIEIDIVIDRTDRGEED